MNRTIMMKAIEDVAGELVKPVLNPLLARRQGRGHKQGRTPPKNHEQTRKARRLMSKRSRQINRRK